MEKNQANKEPNKANTQEQENSGENKKGQASSGAAAAFIFLAVVFSLSAGGMSFLLFQQLEKTRTELTQQLETTRNNLSDVSIKVSGQISGQLSTMTDKMGRMSSEQQQFQHQVSQQQQATEALSRKLQLSNQQMIRSIEILYKQKGRERIGWVLAEVEYLLLIANHSLHLKNEVQTAITALEAADSRLLDTGDPGTIDTRTRISDEIQKLKALQQPDIVGMTARLGSVIKMVPELPIKYTQIHTKKKIEALIEKKASHDAGNLEQASKDFLHELRGLVVIRKLGETPKPLMTPEQQFFLQQNLQLKLETARNVLLTAQDAGHQELFDENLNEAIQWLQNFFDMDVAIVRQTIEELNTLKSMTITSVMPDISGSIKVLRSYQKELEKQQEAEQ